MADTETVRVINGSTPLIKLATKDYPRYYRNLKADNTQTIFSSDTLPVDELDEYGYAVVNATNPPVGDVVTQGAPALGEDGEWYQTWVVSENDPSLKFTEKRQQVLAEALSLVETELSIGIPFTKEVDGEELHFHLQAGEQDRANWVGVFAVAQMRISTGNEDTTTLRTYENTFVTLTPAEIVTTLLAVMSGIDETYKRYWAFKDAVNLLKVGDDIPAVPETFLE